MSTSYLLRWIISVAIGAFGIVLDHWAGSTSHLGGNYMMTIAALYLWFGQPAT